MNKLLTYSLIGLLSFLLFSCFQEEVVTEGCIIDPGFLNLESKFAAELATLGSDEATCEEKKTAGDTIINFFNENEDCINEAIDYYYDSEDELEKAEQLKTKYETTIPMLKEMALVTCS
ncbi:hypothetical protein [Flammeovirga sp. EKP202]|uniref:hypothetical protein n=1 Tax=Flammeovirga sp. EKP202 TaxID=2770592 RepID=UPI00165FA39A|nr:hypothetical protein [Flammeovirga sp. EKP202]MBD0400699.1 hypothetical protein [Flammeovirga sp. EKP202]